MPDHVDHAGDTLQIALDDDRAAENFLVLRLLMEK
jgi:hypothetical protein